MGAHDGPKNEPGFLFQQDGLAVSLLQDGVVGILFEEVPGDLDRASGCDPRREFPDDGLWER